MREILRRVLLPTVLAVTAPVSQAQLPAAGPAAAPPAGSKCPDHGVDEIARNAAFDEYRNLRTGSVSDALEKAYRNTVFTGWNLAILEKAKCESALRADAAKREALADFRASSHKSGVTQAALQAIETERLMVKRHNLAVGANNAAIEQFLELRMALDASRQEDATRLAALIPTYPLPPRERDVRIAQVLGEVSKAQATANKAQSMSKDVRALADEAAQMALAMNAPEGDTTTPRFSPESRAAAANNALTVRQKVGAADRLAKDAQDASDVAVGLALRAQGRTDTSLARQDLAVAQGMEAQLKFDKDRLDYLRTDALLRKLGIQASQDQTLSIAKQREYVTYLSVVANNPDAQALLGSPGVKLTANSGESTATLKLSVDKVLGLEQRLFDFTVSAPTTKNRTSIANSLDGLAGGITAQVTASRYFLLQRDGKPRYFGILGAGGKVGHETHTYVDEADFSSTKDVTKTPSSYFIYAGVAPVTMKSLVLGKFEYQNAFKDAESATECPVQAAGPVVCQSGPIGLPSQVHKRIWSLEFRHAWDAMAIGVALSRDTVARQTKVDIPVYLLTGSDGKGGTPLTGGINFSWDNKNHGSVGLFIGSQFSVLDY